MKASVYSLCLFGLLLVCEGAISPQSHWRQYHPKSLAFHKVNHLAAVTSSSTTKAPVTTETPTPTKTKTSTKAPVTTKAPLTTEPPVTTKAPVTTAKPPVTTKAPVTTAKPPVTTKAPVTTAKPTTTKPTPPHCTPGQKIAVNGTCRNYIECDKSFKWVNMTCSTWCHNFNPATSKCDWSWKYECSDPVTASPCTNADLTTSAPSETTTAPPETTTAPPETTTAPPETTTAPQTTTTTPSTTTIPPCSNGTKKVFQKGDCKDYLECDSGKWVKKSCSFGYDFDINKLDCVWSWWAKC